MAAAQKPVSPVVVVVAIVVLLAVIGLIFKFTLFPSQELEVSDDITYQSMPDGSVMVAPPGFPGMPPPPPGMGGAPSGQ